MQETSTAFAAYSSCYYMILLEHVRLILGNFPLLALQQRYSLLKYTRLCPSPSAHKHPKSNTHTASSKKSNMALARLALKNLRSRVVVSPPPAAAAAFLSDHYLSGTTSTNGAVGLEKQTACWSSQLVKRFTTTTTTTTTPSDDDHGQNSAKPDDLNLGVAATAKKPSNNKLFPRRKRRQRGGGLWNWWSRGDHHDRDFLPSLDLSGIGNALVQATRNINMLLENLSPSHLMGRFKEKDECYKIKFHMPGLSKEEVKITIQDGILVVRGEHKEEGEEDSDDEHWSYASQGYYSTSMLLPEDARVDEIKAEMKDGVLCINIPKAAGKKRDVKEVEVY